MPRPQPQSSFSWSGELAGTDQGPGLSPCPGSWVLPALGMAGGGREWGGVLAPGPHTLSGATSILRAAHQEEGGRHEAWETRTLPCLFPLRSSVPASLPLCVPSTAVASPWSLPALALTGLSPSYAWPGEPSPGKPEDVHEPRGSGLPTTGRPQLRPPSFEEQPGLGCPRGSRRSGAAGAAGGGRPTSGSCSSHSLTLSPCPPGGASWAAPHPLL